MTYQPVDYPPKPCKWCGGDFKPKTSHQNFCGKGCYRRYGKKHLGHSQGAYGNWRNRPGYGTPRPAPQVNYRDFKLDYCEHCGFTPKHTCQLDVDHIDGDHYNNDPQNLQTLCANCHRYKTGVQRGWIVV